MKTKVFAVLFFVLPAVALAKEGSLTPAFDEATANVPAFDEATANVPAFDEATANVPAFDEATANVPAFAKATAGKGGDPVDIKVVISQKRIWLVADEMPMKCLKTKVTNSEGKIVLEKCFTSKCAEWFLNIETLPKGEYTLHLGSDYTEKFKK